MLQSIQSIKLKNLNFSYGDNNIYLKNLNAEFTSGKIYLLQGKNGSGKSTLIKLITKLYNNHTGDIYVNENNIKEISRNSLLEKIGILFQETPVFLDSIINNIILDREYKDTESILNLFEFKTDIEKTGRSITDILYEKNNLSGGQAQKLGIIRTLLIDKSMYIFDEPTSNLDESSRVSFYTMLNTLKKNRIIFLISHELEAEKYVDEIFCLNRK